MNKLDRFNLYITMAAVIVLSLAAITQAGQINKLTEQINQLGRQATVDIGQNDNAYKQLVEFRNDMAVVQSRQDKIWNVTWLDYGEENPAIALTWVHRENLDKIWPEVFGYTRQDRIPEIEFSRIDQLHTNIYELQHFQQCVMNGHCPDVRIAYYLHECAMVAFDKGKIDARTYFYDECAEDSRE